MAYGEVFEGTGEELAKMFAAMGQRRVQVTVRDEPKPFDRERHERNLQELARITAHTKPLPSRSFTAEDFYLPDRFGPSQDE